MMQLARSILRIPSGAAAGILCGSLIVSACSAAATPVPTAAPTAAASLPPNTFQIKNTTFPATITVVAGTTVTWANADIEKHTVTADDGSFDSGDVLAGAKYEHAFAAAGTFKYHCIIHESMHGTVTVTPS